MNMGGRKEREGERNKCIIIKIIIIIKKKQVIKHYQEGNIISWNLLRRYFKTVYKAKPLNLSMD